MTPILAVSMTALAGVFLLLVSAASGAVTLSEWATERRVPRYAIRGFAVAIALAGLVMLDSTLSGGDGDEPGGAGSDPVTETTPPPDPETLDTDGDGVLNPEDACPDEFAETEDGCPTEPCAFNVEAHDARFERNNDQMTAWGPLRAGKLYGPVEVGTPDDEDWFVFCVAEAAEATVGVFVAGAASDPAAAVSLRSENGVELSASGLNTEPGRPARFTESLDEPGRYYLVISLYDSFALPTYHFRVRADRPMVKELPVHG